MSPVALNEASSGLIVLGTEKVNNQGLKLHLHAISSLRANVVIVLGQDNLYNKLQKKFMDDEAVKVIKLPKSGGVAKKDGASKAATVGRCARGYFGVEERGGKGR